MGKIRTARGAAGVKNRAEKLRKVVPRLPPDFKNPPDFKGFKTPYKWGFRAYEVVTITEYFRKEFSLNINQLLRPYCSNEQRGGKAWPLLVIYVLVHYQTCILAYIYVVDIICPNL